MSDNKMIVRKKSRKDNYTIIPNAIFADKSLSWEAIGMLTWILSKPEDWTVYVSALASYKSKDVCKYGKGKTAVYRIIDELIDAGYIKKEQMRNLKGQIQGCSYHVSDEPIYKPAPAPAPAPAPVPAPEPELMLNSVENEYTEEIRNEIKRSFTEPVYRTYFHQLRYEYSEGSIIFVHCGSNFKKEFVKNYETIVEDAVMSVFRDTVYDVKRVKVVI